MIEPTTQNDVDNIEASLAHAGQTMRELLYDDLVAMLQEIIEEGVEGA